MALVNRKAIKVRQQIMHDQNAMTQRCIEEPDAVVEDLKELVRAFSGKPDFEFEPHFTPKYRPWQQRLAFCPEGDIFRAAVDGKLTVVTDTLGTFTETGVRTSDGTVIDAAMRDQRGLTREIRGIGELS